MALFRNLGPFRTTAIGHGEMPLTIENQSWSRCRYRNHCTPRWMPDAVTSTPLGRTTRRAKRNRPAKKLVREALDSWKGPA